MEKKNYQKPAMKAVKLKMKHLLSGSPGQDVPPGSSYAREYRGSLDWNEE